MKAVCQPSEAARGVFSRLAGFHRTHQQRQSRRRRVHNCCRSWMGARKDSGHCRKIGNVHRLSSSGRAVSEDAACRHHPLIKSITEARHPEKRKARQDIHRQAAERLALMGRAVSVSQSLPGLRSCQSLPHGCCLMSGFAAVVPTRPAISVLGGCATSSASLQSHSSAVFTTSYYSIFCK